MERQKVLISGYVSMDRIIKIVSEARVGHTSCVSNRTNADLHFGGCSMNIAAALNRLDIQAIPLIRVGRDYRELFIPRFMEEFRIPAEGMSVVEEELTSRSYLIQDARNNHITLFYEGAMDGKYWKALPDECFEQTALGILTVSSVHDNMMFLRKCREHDIPVVFGMKGDSSAFPRDFLWEVLSEARLIFVNEEEERTIEELFQCGLSRFLKEEKAGAVITTMGKNGSRCRFWQQGEMKSIRMPPIPVSGEIFSAGAGDAYLSGFVYAWLRGLAWENCCLAGAVTAWMALQKEGCTENLPDRDRLHREMQKRRAR